MKNVAIIITYNPEISRLKKVLDSLTCKDLDIIIVDNTPENESTTLTLTALINNRTGIKHVPLQKNTGIAFAQNIGIAIALKENYENIILSDQDTIYPINFFSEMQKELEILQQRGEKIAVIGPAYCDKNKPNVKPSFERYDNGTIRKISQDSGTIRVSQLIASGMLIPAAAIREIGGMAEDLFIDWVDLEWCWRAINAGYSLYGTFNVKIDHQLGDKSKTIFGKKISIHSPFRNYFIIRNGLHLALRGNLLDSFLHRYYLLKRVCRYFIGMCLLSENRVEDVKMMLRGFADGIRGKLGPLQ